ncbi:MAG: hypothetical protein HC849_19170 [Oscillatoriales cyanobacterium RU_3_3]|nr:hypothetical protein [Oscillatoriales cyanobacterium RU_3_3]
MLTLVRSFCGQKSTLRTNLIAIDILRHNIIYLIGWIIRAIVLTLLKSDRPYFQKRSPLYSSHFIAHFFF